MSAEKTPFEKWLAGVDSMSLDEIEAAAKDLPISQRVVVAQKIRERVLNRKEAARKQRRRVKSGIRARTPKGERQPCFICDGFQPITVRHHINPVASSDPDDPASLHTAWLCPNCHAIVHRAVIKGDFPDGFTKLLTPEQWARVDRVVGGNS